ncbi:MAG: efflux RND transporter permease subunit [Xanthomonadaceae bacterium]|nr:efflux RND transporter permease subunit [Xanthomonadaceae bacterium]
MSLAEWSLRRPVTAIMFYVSLMVLGAIAAFRLPLEQFPAISAPFLYVELPYPGATPEEVERTLVRPVEEALATLPGLANMFSQSRGDGGGVFIEFSDWSRDVSIAANEARERIDAIRPELPDDFQRYFVMKFSTTDEPVLRLRFTSERDLRNEYAMLERNFKRRMERIPGVARVDIVGVEQPEVEIAIDPMRLGAHNLSLNDLAMRLRAVNFSISAGSIDDGLRRIRVQPVGEIHSLDELRDLVLDERGLRLSDIAEVRFQPQRAEMGRLLDGRPAVGVDVYREAEANLVEMSRAVLAEMDAIEDLPELGGIQWFVADDQADSVRSSLAELLEAGIVGSLFALLVLFYFLRQWSSTLMVALAIPLCLVMTLGVMYFHGVTLNVLTLMGLLLAVGMLVDNAVVVVESIHQYRAKYPDDPVRCAIEGTRSVQLAISAGTLTSIIVFVPNLFGEVNQISIFLGQVALTITIALLSSWLVAVSLIPMIAARIPAPSGIGHRRGLVPWLSTRYADLLRWTLEHRGWSVAGILLVVVLGVLPAATGMMKVDMFQEDEGREIDIYFDWRGSYSIEQMRDEMLRVERFLDQRRDEFQIEQIYVVYSERGWGGIDLTLRSTGAGLEDTAAIRERLREALPRSALAEIGIEGTGGPGGGGGGRGQGVRVSLTGDSSTELQAIAAAVLPLLAQRPELRDVRIDTGDEVGEVRVSVDRERAAAYGFSAEEVAQYLGIALRGTPLREFRRDGDEIPVWVRFDGAQQFRVENLGTLHLTRPDGSRVPLTSVVDVAVVRGASQIQRENRRTALAIAANRAEGKTSEDARRAIDAVLSQVDFPPGYGYRWGGDFQRNDQAGAQMAFNTLIALIMIFIVMAALFESLLHPLAIMSSVLFSAFGVFWFFVLTGTTFTIMSAIGILVLMGVVVNNGIVMVEHINNLRRAGKRRIDALVEGSGERLRPILMTMGTTILGMLPLAVGGAQIGGEGPAYYPMARAIVGGLAFSTVVSLLFLPTIYSLLDDLGLWGAAAFQRARLRAGLGPAVLPG